MHTLLIVPARAGSKRLPRKNIRPLAGKPLVAWSIETALATPGIARVVVSSDDAEVLAIAATFGPHLPLARPAELASDTAPAIEYVQHALRVLESEPGATPFEAVVILQPTSPLTTPADVRGTLDVLARSGADSAVSVVALAHDVHPIKMKTLDGDRLLPFLEPERGRMMAHQLPDLYVRNCSVYAARRATVEAGQIIGDDCRAFVMPRERSVDINDEFDFAFAEFLMGKRLAASGNK